MKKRFLLFSIIFSLVIGFNVSVFAEDGKDIILEEEIESETEGSVEEDVNLEENSSDNFILDISDVDSEKQIEEGIAVVSDDAAISTISETVASGTCGDDLTWVLDNDGVLTIEGTGSMTSAPASSYTSSIKSIVIGDEVTSISDAAFNYCTNLSKVTIGSGVQIIGRSAFGSCVSLSSIDIPDSVITIELGAFYGCTSLTSVTLGTGLETIGNWVFVDCDNLKSITIPSNVTTIGEYAVGYYFASYADTTNRASESSVALLGQSAIMPIEGGYYDRYSDFTLYAYTGSAADFYAYVYEISIVSVGAVTRDLSECSISLSTTSYIYDGSEKKPTVEVKKWNDDDFDDAEENIVYLEEGTDYTVAYKDNVNAGTASVVVTGIGNYTGSRSFTFTIDKADQPLTASVPSLTFDAGITAQITASGKGIISYSSSNTVSATVSSTGLITGVKPGTSEITINAAGNGNYNAARLILTVTVTLSSGKISSLTNVSGGIKVTWNEVAGATGYYVYRKTSSEKNYALIKTITSGSEVNYTDSKVKNNNGTTYLYKVIPYSGNTISTGTAMTTVRLTAVKLSSVKNTSSKKITVKWKKTSKVTGYQIQYSTSNTFKTENKTVKVSGAKKVSKVISKLKKNKNYYVRIRTYKKVNGKTYYSTWSSKKAVKVKK